MNKSLARERGIMLNGIGLREILIIALVVLLFVGGKKLPELAKGIGSSLRELKKAAKE